MRKYTRIYKYAMTTSQMDLPFLQITDLERYKGKDLDAQEIYTLSRKLDGALTKDFICAIPKEFPANGEYMRERVYLGKDGRKFIKRYTLRGNFLESDEDERIYLTAYWRLVGENRMEFNFLLADYLRFKGVNPTSGENQAKFLDYLERTRGNTWKLNYWFDYTAKQFRRDVGYGIIQKYAVAEAKSGHGGKKRTVVSVMWTQDYFDALAQVENWKHFALDVYSQIPHTNGILKKLLYFLGNGNNEFATEYPEGIHVKVELKMLCEFFLAMPERSNSWEHKKSLKRPLEQLKNFGLIRTEEIDDCFVKEERQVYLVLWYLPPSIRPNTLFAKAVEASNGQPAVPAPPESPLKLLLPEEASSESPSPSEALQGQALELLRFWKVADKKAALLVQKHHLSQIEHAIEVMQSYDKPIKSPAKFLEKALEEGWQPSAIFHPKPAAPPPKSSAEASVKSHAETPEHPYFRLESAARLKYLLDQVLQGSTLAIYHALEPKFRQLAQEAMLEHIVGPVLPLSEAPALLQRICNWAWEHQNDRQVSLF